MTPAQQVKVQRIITELAPSGARSLIHEPAGGYLEGPALLALEWPATPGLPEPPKHTILVMPDGSAG